MNEPSSKEKRQRKKTAGPVDISQQLHDGPCQTITAVQMLTAVLLRKMEAARSADAPAVRELDRLLQKAREELVEILRLSRE